MDKALLEQLFTTALTIATPYVAKAIRDHHAATGEILDDAAITATLRANVQRILAEGAAARSPVPPTG